MRLLYVIDSLAPGGAETSLAAMAPGLVRSGVDLHVLPLRPNLYLAKELKDAGAQVHDPTSSASRLLNVIRIVRVVREVNPDLVHTTLYESDIAGRIAAWLTRKPASTSLVGDTYGPHRQLAVHPLKLRLALELDRLSAKYCSDLHAVSASIATAAVRHLHIAERKITVIPRGRDPQKFPFQPSAVRASLRLNLGVSEHSRVILAVGRHEAAKGLADLLSAASSLAPSFPELVVLIAGRDGQVSRELRRQASRSAVPVRFLGHRGDIPDLLAAADLLCFPSVSEGSPGTLIEAMAVGCPIVATEIPANLEVLGNPPQAHAWLAPPHEPVALAEAIRAALQDTSEGRVRNARTRFEREFQIDAVAQRMAEFFTQTAARPHGRV